MSASFLQYFDNPFFQRSLVSFSFDCVISFYCRMYPVSGSITLFLEYHGKGSSSICVAMLCVAIGIVGAILFIYSCVDIGTLLGAALGGCPGFLFSCISIGTSLGVTLGGLPGFICSSVSTCTSLGATLGGLPGFLFCVYTLVVGSWCCCCLVGH